MSYPNITQPKSLRFRNKVKRKYDRGELPCGYCRQHLHKACRPLLQGLACTCSCPRAVEMREEIEAQRNIARLNGTQMPSIEEIAKDFHPKYKASLRHKKKTT